RRSGCRQPRDVEAGEQLGAGILQPRLDAGSALEPELRFRLLSGRLQRQAVLVEDVGIRGLQEVGGLQRLGGAVRVAEMGEGRSQGGVRERIRGLQAEYVAQGIRSLSAVPLD